MNDIESLIAFFGWCSVINIVVLGMSSVLIMAMKGTIIGIHSQWFGIEKSELPAMYFNYLANYKLAIIVFNIVPYIALKIII